MRYANTAHFAGIEGGQADQERLVAEGDPLQELAHDPEGIELVDDELEAIGDLGNGQDDADGIGALLEAIEARPPTRFAYLIHKAAECIRALQAMRSAPASPWPNERVPEEHWRALADEALGLLGGALRKEVEGQALVADHPADHRDGLRVLFDSSLGIGMFRKAFECEREIWERAYWLIACDQAFGKRPWTGPAGWRELLEPRYTREPKSDRLGQLDRSGRSDQAGK